MLGRWLTLALTPYGLVPVLAFVLMAPSLLLWSVFSAHGLDARLPDADYAWGVLLGCALSAAATVGGHRYGVVLAGRRAARLRAYLGDPSRG